MISREKIEEIAGIVRAAYEEPSVDRALDLFEAIARQVPDQSAKEDKTEAVIVEVSPENKPVASPTAEISRPQGNGHSGEAENKAPERGLSQSRIRPDGEKPRPDNRGHREGVRDSKIQSVQPDPKRGGISKGHEGRTALVTLTDSQKDILKGWIDVAREAKFQLSPKSVAKFTGQSYANVIHHSSNLASIGYLKKTGNGRGTVWRILFDAEGKPFQPSRNGVTKCPPARTAPDINSRMGW